MSNKLSAQEAEVILRDLSRRVEAEDLKSLVIKQTALALLAALNADREGLLKLSRLLEGYGNSEVERLKQFRSIK